MTRHSLFRLSLIIAPLALIVLLAAPAPAYSQYLSENSHGDFGVNSGTQPPPSFDGGTLWIASTVGKLRK
jgi:hypothetical protein